MSFPEEVLHLAGLVDRHLGSHRGAQTIQLCKPHCCPYEEVLFSVCNFTIHNMRILTDFATARIQLLQNRYFTLQRAVGRIERGLVNLKGCGGAQTSVVQVTVLMWKFHTLGNTENFIVFPPLPPQHLSVSQLLEEVTLVFVPPANKSVSVPVS